MQSIDVFAEEKTANIAIVLAIDCRLMHITDSRLFGLLSAMEGDVHGAMRR